MGIFWICGGALLLSSILMNLCSVFREVYGGLYGDLGRKTIDITRVIEGLAFLCLSVGIFSLFGGLLVSHEVLRRNDVLMTLFPFQGSCYVTGGGILGGAVTHRLIIILLRRLVASASMWTFHQRHTRNFSRRRRFHRVRQTLRDGRWAILISALVGLGVISFGLVAWGPSPGGLHLDEIMLFALAFTVIGGVVGFLVFLLFNRDGQSFPVKTRRNEMVTTPGSLFTEYGRTGSGKRSLRERLLGLGTELVSAGILCGISRHITAFTICDVLYHETVESLSLGAHILVDGKSGIVGMLCVIVAYGVVWLLTWVLSPLVQWLGILPRFRTVLCDSCFRPTSPFKSTYMKGKRFCEHCQERVEQTRERGQLLVLFGDFTQAQCEKMKSGKRCFFLRNADFGQRHYALDISCVYIDTATSDHGLLERFMTHLVTYPPHHSMQSIHIFYWGHLDDLGRNLKNVLRNNFGHMWHIDEIP